jgi:hypothetical protein
MIMVLRVCLASAALAVTAGAAAAQMAAPIPTPDQLAAERWENNTIMDYRPQASTFIDQPPAWGGRQTSLKPCSDRSYSAGAAPKVVKTLPAPGSMVRPGALVLSITFDQPMACDAIAAHGSPFPTPCPGDKAAVLLSSDRRTVTTVCQVSAAANYEMPIVDFAGAGGIPSERFDLRFTTSDGPPVADVRKAFALEKAGPVLR